MTRRVVVTGIGMVTPLGTGVEKNWEAACSGTSGIGPITKFNASSYASQIAGEVKDFRAEDFVDKQQVRRFDSFIHYAIASARMAMEDSGLKIDTKNSRRVGSVTGCGLGGLSLLEHSHKILLEKGTNFLNCTLIVSPARSIYGAYSSSKSIEKSFKLNTYFLKDVL